MVWFAGGLVWVEGVLLVFGLWFIVVVVCTRVCWLFISCLPVNFACWLIVLVAMCFVFIMGFCGFVISDWWIGAFDVDALRCLCGTE